MILVEIGGSLPDQHCSPWMWEPMFTHEPWEVYEPPLLAMESNETFPLHYLEMCWDLQERRVEEACRVDRRFQPTQQEGEFHRLIMVA